MTEWIVCPQCKHVIDKSKKKCDCCGYIATNSYIDNQEKEKNKRIAKENRRGFWGGMIMIFVVVFGVWYSLSDFSSITKKTNIAAKEEKTNATTSRAMSEADAWQQVKVFIRQNLKAPTTAKFPSFYDDGVVVERLSDGTTYKVIGYVDSQNSFGAMIRTKFYVKFIHIGDKVKILDTKYSEQ
ncbi:MAG: hypothetical protein RR340_11100 [Cloacibacillus sp.]